MSVQKVLKKIFLYLILIAFSVVIGSILASFLYREKLIDHFIREANKHVNTVINIEKISVSSLSNFPQVSLTFKNVFIEESFEGSSYPLLKAEQIDFTFNPIAIFRGNYTIEQIHLINGKCHLKVNQQGEINYNILKPTDTAQNQTVKLDLSKISLEDVTFTYTNNAKNIFLEVSSSSTAANLAALGEIYNVQSNGDINVNYLMTDNGTWVSDKQLTLQANVNYNDEEKTVQINSSTLKISSSEFLVDGTYAFADGPFINLNVEGKDTDIQSLLAILPERLTKSFYKYKSKGNVYFDLKMQGEMARNASPGLEIKFGLSDAEIYHPDSEVKITHADVDGFFSVQDISKLSKAKLQLLNLGGELENNRFTGNLFIKNFEAPYVKCDFEGRVDVTSFLKFYKAENIKSGKGSFTANIDFEGELSDLKDKASARNLKTSGDINLLGMSLQFADFPLPIENLYGNLLFNNNDLALSNVSGNLGASDFLLNGFFKNIVAYLLFENQPVGIESDLKSDLIDLDELLAANKDDPTGTDSQYSFGISPKLMLKFNCNIDKLKFRRFKPSDIRGELKVKNQIALSDGIKFKAMGGPIALTALVDASKNKLISVNTKFNLHNINVDSIFYVFENFNQTFLEDKHLKGKVFADVNAKMTFNDKLHLFSETLTSNITTTIKDGELNNFEPMQQLTKYLDEEKLDHLRFSDLKNNIHIANKTIYLPEMEVSSNVTSIRTSGTHSFDQKINYKVVTPLRSRQKIDRDAAFGAIEEDNAGRSMLYLKITGTTSDYRISYDKQGVKQKVISDLKKEVDELKKAFKNKGLEKTRTIEVADDDYFDWE